MGWNPREDAVRLAVEVINSEHQWLRIAETAEALGWSPRRVNPALNYLIRRDLVIPTKAINPIFEAIMIGKNSKTLAFAKSHT